MPVDTKRVRGPEESQCPLLFLPQRAEPREQRAEPREQRAEPREQRAEPREQRAEPREQRAGGRGDGEVRPLFARCGLVSQAKGSSYLEAGSTKILCGVYGPREAERREERGARGGVLLCDLRLAPFSCGKRGAWIPGCGERDLSLALSESLHPAVCLHRYPRAQIEVNVLVLENGGSVLAHAVTCASMALADAGIEMYDVVLGAALREDGGASLADPELAEEERSAGTGEENRGCVTLALLPNLNQVSGLHADGALRADTLSAAVRMCMESCHKVYPVVQEAIQRAVKRKAPPPEK